ncbi:MAG: M15 family metallopeptidase [Lachnospiraceae bacterium]|nr:M15 family metallopeptidase [Lachnospiraceae bacterium]
MGLREKRKRKRFIQIFQKCLLGLVFLVVIYGFYSISTAGKNAKNLTKIEENSLADNIHEAYNLYNTEILIPEDTEKVILTDNSTESVNTIAVHSDYQKILQLQAGEFVASELIADEWIDDLFYCTEIEDALFKKINGISYTPNEYILPSNLRYLRMLHYDMDGNTYVGEMIVNEKIADTVLEIFKILYENQYPIERMVLVDNYHADDESSMSDNNTSAFNFRQISGSSKLSNHSYGMAIDLNPKYNPYVKTASDGSIICQPENGRNYIDRTQAFPYKIDENDLAYKLFTDAGFTWGGSWNSVKDYQHFEMEE